MLRGHSADSQPEVVMRLFASPSHRLVLARLVDRVRGDPEEQHEDRKTNLCAAQFQLDQ